MRMLQWMCSVSLRDQAPSVELIERMGIVLVTEVVKKNQLRWQGHMLQKDNDDWMKRSMLYEVDGVRSRGRPGITWNQVVKKDKRKCELIKLDVQDKVKRRTLVWEPTGQPPHKRGKRP